MLASFEGAEDVILFISLVDRDLRPASVINASYLDGDSLHFKPRDLLLPRRFPVVLSLLACVALAMVASAKNGVAQTAASATPVKHKPNPYGSPLDTIMSTHLWTDVPQAQDFVRESRPVPKDLRYAPLTGKDPDRPKPRDAANVMALQAELEQSGAQNAARAHGLQPVAKPKRARKRAATGQ